MQTSFVAIKKTPNNEEYDNEANSIETTLMEPFLAKFERELLKNSKSDMIKDFRHLKQHNADALAAKLKRQIRHEESKNDDATAAASGHLFQRYLKEIKNLTIRKKSRVKEEKTHVPKTRRPSVDLLELRKMSKTQIPWNNLDIESADTLLGCVRADVESEDSSEEMLFPDLYSKNGNKISKNQVKRWYGILKELRDEMSQTANTSVIVSANTVSAPSPRKFFANKKRQILEKVVKKTQVI